MMQTVCVSALSAEIFIDCAKDIVSLFPKEDESTYYIPYKPKTAVSPKLAPRGKLYSQYVYIHTGIKSTEKLSEKSDVEGQ